MTYEFSSELSVKSSQVNSLVHTKVHKKDFLEFRLYDIIFRFRPNDKCNERMKVYVLFKIDGEKTHNLLYKYIYTYIYIYIHSSSDPPF